jgi:hypothetical protein
LLESLKKRGLEMKSKRGVFMLIPTLLLLHIGDVKATLTEQLADKYDLQLMAEDISKNAMDSFTLEPLSEEIINRINGVSWKKGAPVEFEDLSYVKVKYWGFDEEEHMGELIVHKKVAEEILEIFKELHEAKFPIEKIRLIDEYDASDDLSMEDNNTSSFCYREVAGKKGTLSKHSYGLAIDINPVQNPCITGQRVSPIEGKEYKNRKNVRKGMIVKDDICYKAFKKRGWIWGGEWKSLKDYQHFQKQIDLTQR